MRDGRGPKRIDRGPRKKIESGYTSDSSYTSNAGVFDVFGFGQDSSVSSDGEEEQRATREKRKQKQDRERSRRYHADGGSSSSGA